MRTNQTGSPVSLLPPHHPRPFRRLGLLRKFVLIFQTRGPHHLSHLLSPPSPPNSNPRLSSLAFPLYSMIKQESWFSWNTKLVADLIALLYKEEILMTLKICFLKQFGIERGYRSMVAGFCEVGLPDKAEILMQEMREIGLKPSVFELRSLVYGYGQMDFSRI
ncbi:UNVERIFIED_CONTAM: Pentatricopeptide repeat-containing protein [Sesamum angustifolium]|uniref:Pentatricopeptide repeat-containing protein n=1 Tax=Sesamum angustifolium TaxID=2727405 RepID=A0AAW2QCW4_9LAMI